MLPRSSRTRQSSPPSWLSTSMNLPVPSSQLQTTIHHHGQWCSHRMIRNTRGRNALLPVVRRSNAPPPCCCDNTSELVCRAPLPWCSALLDSVMQDATCGVLVCGPPTASYGHRYCGCQLRPTGVSSWTGCHEKERQQFVVLSWRALVQVSGQ